MPLRSPKMYFCIFGFQRLVWWPKCTPASSSSFIVIAAMYPPRLASAALRVSVPVPKPRGVRDGDVAPLNLGGPWPSTVYDGPWPSTILRRVLRVEPDVLLAEVARPDAFFAPAQ